MSETMTKDRKGSSVAPASGSASGRAQAVQPPMSGAVWGEQHDQRVYQCVKIWVEQWWEPLHQSMMEAVGQVFGEHRASIRTTTIGLSERIARLETASNYEERFANLAHEAKRETEIPQSELLAKMDGLQRQVDEFNKVADLDAEFRKLVERVCELEKTNSLEARFTKLAHEAKRETEIPQSELLAKIESLQRQVDGNRVANVDARFRELAERVGELEKTNSLEARLTKIANDAKGGPEIQQSELLARIDGLQRQLDELKRVVAEPGPQGPPGRPGKLPLVREYVPEQVRYEADVVIHAGALWQARSDTVHAPPHADWVCLARAGHDALTPTVRGTYDAYGKYKKLDVVACDGAAFIAKRDNPGVCPGDGWQLMSRQGKPGRRGETGERGPRGEKGERGEPGPTLRSWQLDREHYRVSPLMNDGTVWPTLELRELFAQFLQDAGE